MWLCIKFLAAFQFFMVSLRFTNLQIPKSLPPLLDSRCVKLVGGLFDTSIDLLAEECSRICLGAFMVSSVDSFQFPCTMYQKVLTVSTCLTFWSTEYLVLTVPFWNVEWRILIRLHYSYLHSLSKTSVILNWKGSRVTQMLTWYFKFHPC